MHELDVDEVLDTGAVRLYEGQRDHIAVGDVVSLFLNDNEQQHPKF